MPAAAQESDEGEVEEEPANRVPFSFPDLGGFRSVSAGDETEPSVFYSEVRPTGGSSRPSGFGIFSFRDASGQLLTETSVPIQDTLTEGRMFATFSGRSNVGIAFANPNGQEVTVGFHFTDTLRAEPEFGAGTLTIPAFGQVARFVSESPFDFPEDTSATMTFSSSLPVSAIALLQTSNVVGETLYNTLPVIDLSAAPSETAVFMPHIAAGGFWSTDFIIINPTDETIQGILILMDPGILQEDTQFDDVPGNTCLSTLTDTFDAQPAHAYTLPPGGALVWSTRSNVCTPTPQDPRIILVGSARAIPLVDNAAPVVQVVLNSLGVVENEDGQQVFEMLSRAAYSGGPSGTAYRMYVESSGELGGPDSVTSGVVIHSSNFLAEDPYTSPRVRLDLRSLDGTFSATTELRVPSSGQRALFIDEIFTGVDLPDPLRGTLTATVLTPGRTIAVTALRARISEEDRYMITTTPPTEAHSPPTTAPGYLPHLVAGGGWETETILFSGITAQAGAGDLVFTGADGQPHEIPSDE
jgi:hypothetical protein